MTTRFGIACFVALVVAWPASAQVVRFETTIGDFDMVLNPTNNARLQGHVDNMLHYVESGSYKSSWINRADENFVLQMGGFYSHTKRPPMTIASTRPVATIAPVEGEPRITGLSNTFGTVSLALPSGAGGTNQDGGTSSFFVNLASNTFLDSDFTVFAAIPDMTVVNEIMSLMQIDRTTDPMFGAGPGNLAFTDVPLTDDGKQVFIQRAFVIEDAAAIARATSGVQSVMSLSAGGGRALGSSAAISSTAVPEPASLFSLVGGALGLWAFARRRRR